MRKGVTPVVAIVMLIFITLGASGAVWTMYQNIQDRADNDGPNVRITNIKVEQCWTDPGTTNLMLRNGNPDTIDTSQINVYVNGSLKDSASFHETTSGDLVEPQASFRLEIDEELSRASEIKIATTRNSVDFRC